MYKFLDFKKAVSKRFDFLAKESRLFKTACSGDELWNTYIQAFNEEYRQEHICNCCRQFIKNYGNVVAIIDNNIQTLWDFAAEGEYSEVPAAMDNLVKSNVIVDVFMNDFAKLGTDYNHALIVAEGISKPITWQHLFYVLPTTHICTGRVSSASFMSQQRGIVQVFERSLKEISEESVDIVLDLISQKSLYRGEESLSILTWFRAQQRRYNGLSDDQKSNFCWSKAAEAGGVAKIRNTAIGTLLVNICKDMDLNDAVAGYRKIMDPDFYNRPQAPVRTTQQIKQAEIKVVELGLEDSLTRRHAVMEDFTVNNMLFVNRDSKKTMSVFDELKESIAVNPKKFDGVEEVSIENFIKNVVPRASNIEVLVENKHFNNLVTLTAPQNKQAPSLFKWDNGFAWSYIGNLADSSIKERVEKYGGKTSGILRCSLSWEGLTDLDIHLHEPRGKEIWYSSKLGHGGRLDLDMNGLDKTSETPVENIIFTDKDAMQEGIYKLKVVCYGSPYNSLRGFDVEIECGGTILNYHYPKQAIHAGDEVRVVDFEYTHSNGVRVIKEYISSSSNISNRENWNIKSNQFHKVSVMMLSPNYWDAQIGIGNKHYMFMLEDCKNPEPVRGFFNEYLRKELIPEKRVFEMLGDKMKSAYADYQMSGLGFSSTLHNDIICKVEGAVSRIVKVVF